TPGQSCFIETRRGTREESRLGARYLLVLFDSRLRLWPRSSDPRQGRRPARRLFGAKYLSSFTTGESFPLTPSHPSPLHPWPESILPRGLRATSHEAAT